MRKKKQTWKDRLRISFDKTIVCIRNTILFVAFVALVTTVFLTLFIGLSYFWLWVGVSDTYVFYITLITFFVPFSLYRWIEWVITGE